MKLLEMANPLTMTKATLGLAGSAVGLVDTVARGTARTVLSGVHLLGGPGEQATEPEPLASGAASAVPGATTSAAATPAPTDGGGSATKPRVVPVEPHPPAEPPVDVVGQALAAEAALGDRESPEGAGVAHEPRGASRAEEHGDTPLQRAEAEGIDDEVSAALEGDVEPEGHLTEPLVDPADAKSLAAETETLMRAADPDQG